VKQVQLVKKKGGPAKQPEKLRRKGDHGDAQRRKQRALCGGGVAASGDAARHVRVHIVESKHNRDEVSRGEEEAGGY
jgi:hypothetical protein